MLYDNPAQQSVNRFCLNRLFTSVAPCGAASRPAHPHASPFFTIHLILVIGVNDDYSKPTLWYETDETRHIDATVCPASAYTPDPIRRQQHGPAIPQNP
jgi:hypothetical protein